MAKETLGSNQEVLRIDSKKTKAIGAANVTMGGLSIFSSYNVCHSACMALIAGLSAIGIVVSGMPLAFLIPYQLYFWIFGIIILAVGTALYFKMGKCISQTQAEQSSAGPSKTRGFAWEMLVANAGLLFAGFPFAGNSYLIFMILGFAIVITVILVYLFERFENAN